MKALSDPEVREKCLEWDLSEQVALSYADSLRRHIDEVQKAGYDLGVPDEQLEVHDLSKWSDEEFPAYAMNFHGGGAPDPFSLAWLHHIHHNPHHWQFFLFPDRYTPEGSTVENGCVYMPEQYALEMIADWIGASIVYSGTADMSKWLSKNWSRIRLHSKTQSYILHKFFALGIEKPQ